MSAPASLYRVLALVTAFGWVYGVAHDSVTARLCPEYFTIGHPVLFGITSPGGLALLWGTLSTVPVSMLLGALLGAAATIPRDRPPEPLDRLLATLLKLFAAMAFSAVAAGLLARNLAQHGRLQLPAAWEDALEPDRIAPFATVWAAHIASYATAFIGAGILITRIWLQRGRSPLLQVWPKDPIGAVRLAGVLLLAGGLLYWRWH